MVGVVSLPTVVTLRRMNWILLSLLSALFLGVYDIARKASVRGNAVPPVLLLNVGTAAALWLPWVILSRLHPELLPSPLLTVSSLDWAGHGLLLTKSLLVGASWTFGFWGMKHLPISIAAPIRSSSPLWTVLIATVFMQERPTAGQWAGVTIILAAFYAFSLAGRKEGIHFHRDRWVGCMLLATALGSVSALYDKYLLQHVRLDAATVQAWFSIYLVPVQLPLCLYWLARERQAAPFQWRWTIPAVAVLLLISDFLYFTAIQDPHALISLISPLRRSSMIIPFTAGTLLFGESNWRAKSVCVVCLLAGVYVLSFGR